MFLAIVAAALPACADLNAPAGSDGLDDAHARWQATHLTDYQYDFQRICFCAPIVTRPVTITVLGGAFVSVVYQDSGTAADTTYFRQYLTMERVFVSLRHELDAHPASFAPVYDTSAGYPHQVFIDRLANAADDELSLYITAVRPLP